jgi:hypothetical protein
MRTYGMATVGGHVLYTSLPAELEEWDYGIDCAL